MHLSRPDDSTHANRSAIWHNAGMENSHESVVLRLLRDARGGNAGARDELFAKCRNYVDLIARSQVESWMRAKVDASDLVQQTCLSAVRHIQKFDGVNEAAFVAWLRTIHQNNIRTAIRDHLIAQKRAAGRELTPADEQSIDQSLVAASESSPSQRLMRGESAVRLAAALQDLPDDQREAVRLRYLEGRSLAEIAERLDRSVVAAAGLVKRGLIQLRTLMRDED
jgi:RNA polymerase sigma-70 factor (ECF subfamily)